MILLLKFVILIKVIVVNCEENQMKFVVLKEIDQNEVEHWLEHSFIDQQFQTILIDLNGENGENGDEIKICNGLNQNGVVAVIDLTWGGNSDAKNITNNLNLPYIAVDISISPFLRLLDLYLEIRNSTDVAVIFDNPEYVDQSLYHWIDTTLLRMVISESLDKTSSKRIRNIRPIPNNFAIIATTTNVSKQLETAFAQSLVTLPQRWNLLFLDFKSDEFDRKILNNLPINLLYMEPEICCKFLKTPSCECPKSFNLQQNFLLITIEIIKQTFIDLLKDNWQFPDSLQCNGDNKIDDRFNEKFESILQHKIDENSLIYKDQDTLRLNTDGTIDIGKNNVARYNSQKGIQIITGEEIPPIKPFYRIGITHAIPWSYKETDSQGRTYWAGYCADLTQQLSEVMHFDYEFVEPKKGTFGKKRNGVFDGVIGDLASGETDMVITALTMTADREEFVDFVPPYFERTGITIVMRKPIKKTSLFRFMTVLKLEVWLSIVGALVGTGFLIWFLDKYSPYSARNNKNAYPFPCREFTLKESFWFALTSFTPQGGGEAPKALSGRTLVAAYWLFVVLMLATFTANLAAFLTVERMQTPVQSLEQLSKQSRINYTVVRDSSTHIYFINMKNAEDTLYRMWKELVLNASTDDTRYRVWDYPIREQYGHILIAINDSNPLPNASEGFRIVNERTDADFAFIHDSSEIKYEISRNCNLTEVGEVFGERPYAIAVQQGSHLQDEISKSIMILQNDRYFVDLKDKYWNNSAKGECLNTDDNEGITLESLGGVFIATLFGLALAMITLVGEVIYYRRKRKIGDSGNSNKTLVKPGDNKQPITFGTEFKPVNFRDKNLSGLADVTLFPRSRNKITRID